MLIRRPPAHPSDWRSGSVDFARRLTRFTRWARGEVRRKPPSPSTVGHDWKRPLHTLEPRDYPERVLCAEELLDGLDQMWQAAKGPPDEHLFGPLLDDIHRLLTSLPALPRAFAERPADSTLRAPNVGWEIETTEIMVKGRVGRIEVPDGYFVEKLLVQKRVNGLPGFEVQTDGGHLELVSDPPKANTKPERVATDMAKHSSALLTDLQSRRGQVTWETADPIDRRRQLRIGGKQVEYRLSALSAATAVTGSFHATLGVHLSSIPWLYLSATAMGDRFSYDLEATKKSESGTLRGPLVHAPMPGHSLRSDADRRAVLDCVQRFRRAAVLDNVHPSPELDGLAFLIFAYIVAARAQQGTLSPKQKFLVLARTSLAEMVKLLPEWQAKPKARMDRLGQLLLDAAEPHRLDDPMFSTKFGDPMPSLAEAVEAVRKNKLNELATEPSRRRAAEQGYVKIRITGRQWIGGLMSNTPKDLLSVGYHKATAGGPPPRLFRGMGELGATVDAIPGVQDRAPIFELRNMTPTANPSSNDWGLLARSVVDVVTTLNAPASAADIRNASWELDLIRRAGLPDFGRNQGRLTPEAFRDVDGLCREIDAQIAQATMQSDLWTLLDRARSLTTRARSPRP